MLRLKSVLVQQIRTKKIKLVKKQPTPLGKLDNDQPIIPADKEAIKDQNSKENRPKVSPEEALTSYRTTVSPDIKLDQGGIYYNIKTGEKNGPKGPEPTRFGDWEHKGRISDF